MEAPFPVACGIPHRLCVNWPHPRLPDGAAREEGPGDPIQTPARTPQRSAVRHVVGSMPQVRGRGLDRSRVSPSSCSLACPPPHTMFLFKLLWGVGLFPPDCILQQGRAAVLSLTEAPVMCLMSLTPCLLSCLCATSQSHHTCSLPKGEAGIVPTGGPSSGKNHGKGAQDRGSVGHLFSRSPSGVSFQCTFLSLLKLFNKHPLLP